MIDYTVQEAAERELKRLGIDPSKLSENMLGNMICAVPKDTQIESIRYNVAYWTQALLKNPKTLLRFDNLEQILYSSERISLPLTSSSVLNSLTQYVPPKVLLHWFIKNLPDVLKEVQDMLVGIQKQRETGNVIILSNHASWLNLPLIAILLQTYGGIPKEHIFTLLGPAITTQQLSYAGITNFSNLIKTVPDTKNGNIQDEDEELKKLVTGIKRKMFQSVKEIFLNTDSLGNIFLIAPSGTTDLQIPGERSGFLLQKPSLGTKTFIELLARKEHNSFVVVGSNDKQVMPNNTSPRRGEVYMKASTLVGGTENALNLLDALHEYVLNKEREKIGKWKD